MTISIADVKCYIKIGVHQYLLQCQVLTHFESVNIFAVVHDLNFEG